MTQRKCSSCGKPAFAYQIEADGKKTYLCLEHLPDDSTPYVGNPQKSPDRNPPDHSPNSN